MSFMLLSTLGATLTGAYVETKHGPRLEPNSFGLSPLFGLTPALLSYASFWTTYYGMKVGAARRKYTKQAIEDGEENVEDRYGLPNLYAQGISKNAKAFNSVQRSHQHIMETFTQLVFTGLMGAVYYPICTACSTSLYMIGRYAFSSGYGNSEGEVAKRYSHPLARYMWYGLLGNFILSFLSSISIIRGKKIL